MNLNFKKIYVTGGNGWLGRQLIVTLINGDKDVLDGFVPGSYEINALILNGEDYSFLDKLSEQIHIYEGDLRRKSDCVDFLKESEGALLIHTAGIIHPRNVSDFFTINVEGTRNLVDTALSNKIRKIVAISSNSQAGCNIDPNELFDENSPYNPYMNYGKSKMEMERYLLSKISEGADITILRPPWFYGAYQPDRQIVFYKMIKDGKVPVVGSGENLRSKANVKNISQAIILSAVKGISKGRIYWIADERPYSFNEIIDTIREVIEKEFGMKCSKKIFRLPFIIGQIAQKIDKILQRMNIYSQKIHVLSELNKNIACKVDRAKNELGYDPKIDLYIGTKQALEMNETYKKLN